MGAKANSTKRPLPERLTVTPSTAIIKVGDSPSTTHSLTYPARSSTARMELDSRKQRILEAIVLDYVATAEPVGSHVLVERYSLGVKSATIRNEMAEMSDRGYLRQPHTSAGRVPSDLGYRFYVDQLMQLPVVPVGESSRMRRLLESAATELDAVLRQTCRLLADMTRLPAVATSPQSDDLRLRQVIMSPAGSEKTLLVLLFSNGRTDNRLLTLKTEISDAAVLANALTARWGETTINTLGTTMGAGDPPPEINRLASHFRRLSDEIFAVARRLSVDAPMYVEGAHAVLNHPEFRDVERLSQFIATLQERAAMLDILRTALDTVQSGRFQVPVRVTIGGEMGRAEMTEYSLVTSPYYVDGRESGSIGVLGPTRMDYGRAASAVGLMARAVGDLLTRLSVA